MYPHYGTELSEGRFTDRRDFCPNPGNWHSADADSTEYEVLELLGGLVRALQPEIVVETGTAFGYGALHIAQALKANGHGKLYTFEIDLERIGISAETLKDFPQQVDIVPTDIRQWTPPGDIEFAFFDSGRTEDRHLEFRYCRQWLKSGSIVAFHDAAPHHAVWAGVQQLERDGFLKPIRLHTPRGLALAEVI